jgi:hypothetical protein
MRFEKGSRAAMEIAGRDSSRREAAFCEKESTSGMRNGHTEWELTACTKNGPVSHGSGPQAPTGTPLSS